MQLLLWPPLNYGRNIQLFFYISDILLFFHKYMKNKIGILENQFRYIHISHSE